MGRGQTSVALREIRDDRVDVDMKCGKKISGTKRAVLKRLNMHKKICPVCRLSKQTLTKSYVTRYPADQSHRNTKEIF